MKRNAGRPSSPLGLDFYLWLRSRNRPTLRSPAAALLGVPATGRQRGGPVDKLQRKRLRPGRLPDGLLTELKLIGPSSPGRS